MAPKVEIIHDETLIVGKAPHWDKETQLLYWVDIPLSTVFRYDPRTKQITRLVVDKQGKTPVMFIIPVAGTKDKFIVACGKKLIILTWDGVSPDAANIETFIEVESTIDNRFNDGKVDPTGRLWAGTMLSQWVPGEPELRRGSLYSFNAHDKSATTHVTNVGISNGIAFSSDQKTLYYVDTFSRAIDAFDLNIESGELSNRRTVFDTVKNNIQGYPDGMTIDVEDKLWVATFTGSAVHRIDPQTGSLLQSIKLPTSKVTTPAWGGPNFDELYVTTAGLGEPESPTLGRLFKITGLGTSGFPSVPVKL